MHQPDTLKSLTAAVAVALLTACGTKTSTYEKEISIPVGKSFYKEIFYNGAQPVALRVQAHTADNELFDVNVLDNDSYKRYQESFDRDELVFFYKIQDRKLVDTTFQLQKGNYLFGFENFANNDTIRLYIKMSTTGKINLEPKQSL